MYHKTGTPKKLRRGLKFHEKLLNLAEQIRDSREMRYKKDRTARKKEKQKLKLLRGKS